MDTQDPRAQREVHMRERLSMMHRLGLSHPGNICPLLEMQVLQDTAFLLLPKA
eukprot:CAMPEP_0176319548 /NCGR_PEP_ID=MMETSP0121_2-20121125/70359_1 /TAXON_ID=160619 /ORGANISM="Kryptoperidinium foliaceum, Strain CCMP 1326" /LENGTH=52 /DNA_ID=CAMNT_0017661901 /DNA_START=42 /DNA_END=197 /DNA_ORIENTATION=-